MQRIPLGNMDVFLIPTDQVRPCGECKACCTALGVVELHKRNYEPCRHECAKGCTIHGKHPDSCKDFNCWWKVGKVRGDRPGRSSIVVESAPVPGLGAVIRVWEVKPGALKWQSNRKVIEKLKDKYAFVLEGTKDTFGNIWIEDAPAEAQQEYKRTMEQSGQGILAAVRKILGKG
jgi:hypothetical protein